MTSTRRYILAVTGASGSVFARSLVRSLVGAESVGVVDVVMSDAALRVAREELAVSATRPRELVNEWLGLTRRHAEVVVHDVRDIGASMASGSLRHDGMVVAPCSTGTLAAIAHGTTTNLVHRAAECALKERRRLILLTRETPLSTIHLENMLRVTQAGAIVMPLSPPWYHRPRTLDDLVDDTCARALDHLGLPDLVRRRWDGKASDARD